MRVRGSECFGRHVWSDQTCSGQLPDSRSVREHREPTAVATKGDSLRP